MSSQRDAIARTVDELVDDVAGWPNVTVHEHRYGGTEFRVGPREIGHVHAWGMLDIAYLRRLRDELVAADHTGIHHLLAESGWTTYHITGPDDYDHARWLLRLSYLYHVNALKKTPAGAAELADVDVDAELDAMDLPQAILDAIHRR